MSVLRISEFHAKPGQAAALVERLKSFAPLILASKGCSDCRVLQGEESPSHIVVLETWDSAEAHQAAVKGIPSSAYQETIKLLAAVPKGEYFSFK